MYMWMFYEFGLNISENTLAMSYALPSPICLICTFYFGIVNIYRIYLIYLHTHW